MIRVGLIGAGFIGHTHFIQWEKLKDRAKVVALCDKEEDRRSGDWSKVAGNVEDIRGTRRGLVDIKPYVDWPALVADPNVDLVDVCTPTFVHPEMVIEALGAGKHVLCEKPMALSVEGCDAILAAAAKARGKLMIAQCIRFWPQYVHLKQVVDDRRHGPLKALYLYRQGSPPHYSLNNWILDPELSGGAILDLHVHDVDYALYLFGKPKSVHAQGCQRTGGGIDRVHSLWDCGPDRVVQLEGYWDMPPAFGFTCGFTAVFENATLQWDLASGRLLTVLKKAGGKEFPEVLPNDGYFNEIDYFVDCVEHNRPVKTSTPRESRDAVAIALAEKESARTGQPVAIT